MTKTGDLIVFEGPDGAGKSALANAYTRYLQSQSENVTLLSFPGLEEGTLGYLVYKIHHDSLSLGIRQLTATSLQALHVAAHLDTIERAIVPRITRGETVILDRFWWSTWVYGTDASVPARTLEALIATERAHWGSVSPTIALLITRRESLKPEESGELWRRRAELYAEVAEREAVYYPVRNVSNDGTESDALAEIIRIVGEPQQGRQSRERTSPIQEDVTR